MRYRENKVFDRNCDTAKIRNTVFVLEALNHEKEMSQKSHNSLDLGVA